MTIMKSLIAIEGVKNLMLNGYWFCTKCGHITKRTQLGNKFGCVRCGCVDDKYLQYIKGVDETR